jgi:hypothetical protein
MDRNDHAHHRADMKLLDPVQIYRELEANIPLYTFVKQKGEKNEIQFPYIYGKFEKFCRLVMANFPNDA